MVGVPGKYKGCESCRLRRVKCDNTRPRCRKCEDSGRECLGYQRKQTFINATLDHAGRCSSHPPRKIVSGVFSSSCSSTSTMRRDSRPRQSTKTSSPLTSDEDNGGRLVWRPTVPPQPAWDNTLDPSIEARDDSQVYTAALHITSTISRHVDGSPNGTGERTPTTAKAEVLPIELSDYHLQDLPLLPSHMHSGTTAQSLLHINRGIEDERLLESNDNYLLFLYDHDKLDAEDELGLPARNILRGHDFSMHKSSTLDPTRYQHLPAHSFFGRFQRPFEILTALLRRSPCDLSGPDWTALPWEGYPKSNFDHLLDLIVLIPEILARYDSLPLDLVAREQTAQSLLIDCLILQGRIDQWQATAQGATAPNRTCCSTDLDDASNYSPFGYSHSFRDTAAAMSFIFYHTAQIVFLPCIQQLFILTVISGTNSRVLEAFTDDHLYTNIDPRATSFDTDVCLQEELQRGTIATSTTTQQTIDIPGVLNPFQPTPAQPPHAARFATPQVRAIANDLCRSLDFVLETTSQPDLLVVPLTIAEQFFSSLELPVDDGGMSVGDGFVELMWLQDFRHRLQLKSQQMAAMVQSKRMVRASSLDSGIET